MDWRMKEKMNEKKTEMDTKRMKEKIENMVDWEKIVTNEGRVRTNRENHDFQARFIKLVQIRPLMKKQVEQSPVKEM